MQKETLLLIGGIILGLAIISFVMWDITHFALFSPASEQIDAKSANAQEEAYTDAGAGKILAKTDAPSAQTPSVKSASSNGEEGAGASFSPPTAQDCAQTQIAYGLRNFNAESNCLNLQDTICLEKKVDCSVLVQNIDKDTSGSFRIRFSLYDTSDPDKISLQQGINEQIVASESEQQFQTSFIVYNDTAQKQLTCDTHTEIVPKKNVCNE